MVQFREDTSFPYLKIAREYGVPYRLVLSLSDNISQETPKVRSQLVYVVLLANLKEIHRRNSE